MARKAVPEETMNNVLLKSRRRCCLCFWLEGIDEVKKGQVAHLDQNNENCAEDNLVFLCLEHHDAYDGRTSVSKGFRKEEVRKWRDELHKEMEHRSRSVQKRCLELSIIGSKLSTDPSDNTLIEEHGFQLQFRLRNTGEVAIHNPTVSFALSHYMNAYSKKYIELVGDRRIEMNSFSRFEECREDFFEPNGRIAQIMPMPPMNPVLIKGHSVEFEGLQCSYSHHFPHKFAPTNNVCTQYRIDAEDMTPIIGELTYTFPDDLVCNISKLLGYEQQ